MEKYQEIERSIIKTYRKDIWKPFVKAVADYKLIEENDKIMVCISGGKDSFLLAKCMQELQKHWIIPFETEFVCMDPGYNPRNLELIKENAKICNIPLQIFDTKIFQIVEGESGSPCYLCARMRRGALYTKAKELGCNKIALGHHFNDVIETTLLSMIYGGEIKTMMPKLHSDNFEGLELIRPCYMVKEDAIINWKNKHELTFLNCACRFTERASYDESASKRKMIKEMIKTLQKDNRNVEGNIFQSMHNVNLTCVLGYHDDFKKVNFTDWYDDIKLDESLGGHHE